MKILFVSKLDYSGLTEGISHAFQTLGFSSHIFDVKRYRKIEKYLDKNYALKKFQGTLHDYKPDCIFIIAPFFINFDYFVRVEDYKSKQSCKTIGWVGDAFDLSADNILKLNLLDTIYYTDTGFFNIYNAYNTSYLPLATDSRFFFKRNLKPKFDCTFVASETAGRLCFLEAIDQHLHIFGPGWKKAKLKQHSIKSGKLKLAVVSKIYSRSLSVLNIKNERNVFSGLNQRSFDPCASGALLFHDYVADLELNFDLEKEMIVFKNNEEFKCLYDKVMRDVSFRKRIAENGTRRVESHHTFHKRAEQIVNNLEWKQ